MPIMNGGTGQVAQGNRCMILRPRSALCVAWDVLALGAAALTILVEPLFLAFKFQQESDDSWLKLRLYLDLFFLADIVVNAVIGYWDPTRQALKHYVIRHLPLDIIASVPFLIQMFSAEQSMYFGLCRLLRLSRAFRIACPTSCGKLRILAGQLLCVVALVLHLGACVLLSVGSPAELQGESENSFQLYSRALLQCTSLVLHIGDLRMLPLVEEEYLWIASVMSLVGAGLLTASFGAACAGLVHLHSSDRSVKGSKLLPGSCNNAREILDILPPGLQRRLQMHMLGPSIRASPLFLGPHADYGFVSSILPLLESCSFREGQRIFCMNERPRQVYFLESGIVHLSLGSVSPSPLFATLSAGAMLGQEAFLFNANHLFTALCVTPCHCASADGNHFFAIGAAYPDTLAFMRTSLNQQISFFTDLAERTLASDGKDQKLRAPAEALLDALQKVHNADDFTGDNLSLCSGKVASEFE